MAKGKENRNRAGSDPLDALLEPPSNETPKEKETRLTRELKAKKKSDSIDEMIKQERKKRSASSYVKVLLLGQSESGKSTTLKQFQILHTPNAFHAERSAWRTVVYLNLIRTLLRVLDAIAANPEGDDPSSSLDLSDSDLSAQNHNTQDASNAFASPSLSLHPHRTPVPNYEEYRTALDPLYALEERLNRMLCGIEDENEVTRLGPLGALSKPERVRKRSLTSVNTNVLYPPTPKANRFKKEVALHTSTNWKKAFVSLAGSKLRAPDSLTRGDGSAEAGLEGWWDDSDDVGHVLNRCSDAMHRMWADPCVRKRLSERGLRLEESSGFYLDEIPRITGMRYMPTDDDVLKARLKTMGVIEHEFTLSAPLSLQRGTDWKIYDVGGARHQRQAWAPYFQDVNAIIFLAPISAFDQVLNEDPRVNRLEDSLLLWKSVTQNKLLQHVNIILFLNKCDLLQTKLDAGVRLNQYLVSYGDRPNDYESVSKYFRNKFGALHQSFSPNKDREIYIHLTAVTDTKRTATIIAGVRDFILKGNLKTMSLV